MAVYKLTEQLAFPDPREGDPDGLIAVGGDLEIDRLLLAYWNGIFPWPDTENCLLWFCPMQRFVIFPSEIHISHSMRNFMRNTDLVVTMNQAFGDVVHNCRIMREGETWIYDDIEKAYNELHNQELAISVEVWDEDTLVGGLYGVSLGRVFVGESMFSKVPNASKLALIMLANCMEAIDGLIDCQMETPHLKSMGGRYISYDEYMEILRRVPE